MNNYVSNKDSKKIIQLIKKKSNKKIFKISEFGPHYEIEIDSFNLDNLNEKILTDKAFEWVIYGSHELTIAFGGTWLIEAIEQMFIDRQDKLNEWPEWW